MHGAHGRFAKHLSGHGRAPLLAAKIQELGSDAFKQIILEQDHGDPIEAEQRWYDWYLTNDPRQTLNGRRPGSWDGYGAGRTPWNKGQPRSPETLAKMSATKKGHSTSPETRRKLSEARQGQQHTSETKAKISTAHKGKPKTSESRSKMSIAQCASRWSCDECDMVTNGGALALHQKASKHQGILRCA